MVGVVFVVLLLRRRPTDTLCVRSRLYLKPGELVFGFIFPSVVVLGEGRLAVATYFGSNQSMFFCDRSMLLGRARAVFCFLFDEAYVFRIFLQSTST